MGQIDRVTFDNLKERMKAKFPILLEGYLRDAKGYLVIIESNMPSGDISALIGAVHSLKSASGLMGITKVHAYAEDLEYTAKDLQNNGTDNFESLRGIYENLQESFSAVEGDLRMELDKVKAA